MLEEMRENLKRIQSLEEGWPLALSRILACGASPGPERSFVVDLMVSSAPGTRGLAYLAMLHALWMDQEEQHVAALNSWNLASRSLGGTLDAEGLRVLGLGEEQRFRDRAVKMRQIRANYLKQSLKNRMQDTDKKAYFRIERALSGYLGEASVYSSFPTQRPKVMFVPGLATSGFLDPEKHPVVTGLRRSFKDVQAEFDEVLNDTQALEPFLGHAGALEGYVSGGDRASWDAMFFFRHGRRYHASHQRCPKTSQLLDSLDLCRIESQSPEICFSVLQPGSRIEPHYGVTNARVVVHLPLRVPAGCHLDLTAVGQHHWVEGQPMVFDDTFEHSALNPSDQPRGILLMDAWHPALSLTERDAFSCLITAISRIEQDRMLPAESPNA